MNNHCAIFVFLWSISLHLQFHLLLQITVSHGGGIAPGNSRTFVDSRFSRHFINNPPWLPRTRQPKSAFTCDGVCLDLRTCTSLGGIPSKPCQNFHRGEKPASATSQNYCCQFETTCHTSSKDRVFFYHSPSYPAPVVGNLLCHHSVIIQPGVCGVRLEFLEFNTTAPLDRGLCHVDQFLVINSLDGPAFPRCGGLTKYSTIVPVDPRYHVPLILLNIIQSSKETFKWNIKVTQLQCEHVKQIKDVASCGKNFNSPDLIYTSDYENDGFKKEAFDGKNLIEDFVTASKSTPPSNGASAEENLDWAPREENFLQDNAFYIEYLKQSYQALVPPPDGPEPNPNNTYCKNALNTTATAAASSVSPAQRQRIIRGNDAALYEFPWQISIQDHKGHICGGTVIDAYHIISAAHCFMSVTPINLSRLKLHIGDYNLNTTIETEHIIRYIDTVIFHSHFDPFYLTNDISLIRVSQKISFRKGIQPICLPQKDNSYVGRKATVSGWGATHYPQGKLAIKLQRVENEIIETAECKRVLKTSNIYGTMMCALSPKCSGTCFGDSGGPMIITDKDDGSSRIIGIVSFGIGGCALLPYWPDVYTRVSEYIDWLSYAVA